MFNILSFFCIIYEIIKIQSFSEKESAEVKKISFFFYCGLIYYIWLIIGLTTINWPICLFILSCSIIIPMSKFNKYINLLDSIISLALIVLTLLNNSIYHIDIFEYILNKLN